MSNRSCPCCSDWRVWGEVKILLSEHGAELNYCPVCGQHVGILNFLRNLRNEIELQTMHLSDLIEDENGKPMIQERTPWSNPKDPTKHRSLGVDLDKIDISREMEFLEKHHNKENAKMMDALVMHHLKKMLDDRDIDN